MRPPRSVGAALLAGLLSLAALGPVVLGPYTLIVLTSALVLAMACLGLNLLLGGTGSLSLGHAAYFGLGSYAGAFLFTFGDSTSLETHVVAGMLAATIAAALIGRVCVRATGMSFTILTLAFAQVVHSLFVGGAVFLPFGDTGKGYYLVGHGGLYIPRLTLLGHLFPPERFTVVLYWVVLAAFALVAAVLHRLARSPFGLALRAIRDNDVRAAFVGLDVPRYRWAAFVVSGAVVGLAGALGGQLDRQITPEQLHWTFSAHLVVATVLGGTRHFWGPVVGAFAVVLLREIALRHTGYHDALLGLALVLVILAAPRGLAGLGAAVVGVVTRGRAPGAPAG